MSRRMLYTGLKSDTGGHSTYGQQNSIYYDVVGAKPISGHDDDRPCRVTRH